jgi:hypothetical protein
MKRSLTTILTATLATSLLTMPMRAEDSKIVKRSVPTVANISSAKKAKEYSAPSLKEENYDLEKNTLQKLGELPFMYSKKQTGKVRFNIDGEIMEERSGEYFIPTLIDDKYSVDLSNTGEQGIRANITNENHNSNIVSSWKVPIKPRTIQGELYFTPGASRKEQNERSKKDERTRIPNYIIPRDSSFFEVDTGKKTQTLDGTEVNMTTPVTLINEEGIYEPIGIPKREYLEREGREE